MLANIFDITNNVLFKRYNIKNDKNLILNKSLQMSDTLFVPDSSTNRATYIQNFDTPNIEDIFDGQRLHFDKVKTINQILTNLKQGVFKEDKLLNDFFKLQLKEEDYSEAEKKLENIILIHDDFNPEAQEHILGSVPMNREQSSLLWRSIAACIGAEDSLKELGARDADKVLIVDKQTDNALLSVLTLKTCNRNGVSLLVPQRKFFKDNSPNYKKISYDKSISDLKALPTEVDRFYQIVFSRKTNTEEFIAPHNGSWRTFKKPINTTRLLTIPPDVFNGIKYCIVIGDLRLDIPANVDCILDKNSDLIFTGASKFVYRKHHNLPTYFDHCEALYIVVQDKEEEQIITETLIPEKEDVLGGDVISGEVNDKCFIEKQDSKATFYLIMGDKDSYIKELVHDFGKETIYTQKMILTPRMRPGQGIARVTVNASPLIYGDIELNFREMLTSKKTLSVLQNELKRSFPIDMPLVEASDRLWANAEFDVNNYLTKGCAYLKNINFAKAHYINPAAQGIERFKRKNVFGIDNGRKIPSNADPNKIGQLLNKLHNDYNNKRGEYMQEEVVRVIAWTYTGENTFKDITEDVLLRIEFSANNLTALPRPYFSYCSNNLSRLKNINRFYNAFCLRMENEFSRRNFKFGVWINGFSNILTFNNNFFDIFKRAKILYTPEYCMNLLFKALQYSLKNKKPMIFKDTVCAMLFLLKYRKYDSSFLKSEPLYGDILDYIAIKSDSDLFEEYKNSQINIFFASHSNLKIWLKTFKDYLTGAGTIDGIPRIDDD